MSFADFARLTPTYRHNPDILFDAIRDLRRIRSGLLAEFEIAATRIDDCLRVGGEGKFSYILSVIVRIFSDGPSRKSGATRFGDPHITSPLRVEDPGEPVLRMCRNE